MPNFGLQRTINRAKRLAASEHLGYSRRTNACDQKGRTLPQRSGCSPLKP